MIHLIRADLRRVLKRPTLYIFAGLMMIFIIFAGWSEDAMAQMSTEKNTTAYLVAIMASGSSADMLWWFNGRTCGC